MYHQEPAMEDNDNAEANSNQRQEHKVCWLLLAGIVRKDKLHFVVNPLKVWPSKNNIKLRGLFHPIYIQGGFYHWYPPQCSKFPIT